MLLVQIIQLETEMEEKCETEVVESQPQPQRRRSKVRLRGRTLSTGRAEDIVTAQQKARQLQPDKPIHSPCDSLLSWTSSFHKFEGMFNWGALLLFISSLRVFLENLLKYGVRVSPTSWLNHFYGDQAETASGQWPVLYLLSFSVIPVINTFFLESLLANTVLLWSTARWIHGLNLTVTLVFPIIVINTMDCAIFSSILACGSYTVIVLKLVSYIQVNHWCRTINRRRFIINSQMNGVGDFFWKERMKTVMNIKEAKKVADEEDDLSPSTPDRNIVNWPDNLSLKDITYFMFAPTLCYELNFPKTVRIRKLFLLRRALEVVLGTNLLLGLTQQWIVPNVIHSLLPFHG